MGKKSQDAPDVIGAAREEGRQNRILANQEMFANRMDQSGPFSSTNYTYETVDPLTGEVTGGPGYQAGPQIPLPKLANGEEDFANYTDEMWDQVMAPFYADQQPATAAEDAYYRWDQETTLNPEWQEVLDGQRGQMNAEIDYRTNQTNAWNGGAPMEGAFNTTEFQGGNATIDQGQLGQFAGGRPGQTGADDWREFGVAGQTIGADDYKQQGYSDAQISGDDWRQFGQTGQTIGAGDWQQFGQTGQTIGANDYQQQGRTEQTIGADDYKQQGRTEQTIGEDDWREFGTTDPIMNSGTWDERFGGQDNSGGYGDHGMDGSNWDQVNYAPEAIRQQAQNDTYAYQQSRLDPQWEKTKADAEVQMRNQGLQPGDQQWDDRMESMSKSKSSAYDSARNTSLADSRAEASMLWDQEMGRSQQKNQQTQADVDNIFRARQGNIENYQSQRGQDMQGYLDYNKNAFGQDLASRQQQLDANLDYGNSAYNQDLTSRQQQLDAQLDFGNSAFDQDRQARQQQLDAQLDFGSEAYNQDYRSRQQNVDNNLAYGNEAWNQDYANRQQNVDNNLRYGQEGFNQDYRGRQQALEAQLGFGQEAYNQDYNTRQQGADNALAYGNQSFNQGFQQNQADIGNNLEYGNAAFDQDQQIRQQQIAAQQEAERLNQGRMNAINPTATGQGIVDTFGG
jgi:hypothetical protein